MLTTLLLAKLFGFYMLIVGLALSLRPANMTVMLQDYMKNKGLILVTGMFTLMLGIFLVLAHNDWTFGLTFFVTLFAWTTLLKGITLITFPDIQLSMADKLMKNEHFMRLWAGIAALFGAAFLWFAYMA